MSMTGGTRLPIGKVALAVPRGRHAVSKRRLVQDLGEVLVGKACALGDTGSWGGGHAFEGILVFGYLCWWFGQGGADFVVWQIGLPRVGGQGEYGGDPSR